MVVVVVVVMVWCGSSDHHVSFGAVEGGFLPGVGIEDRTVVPVQYSYSKYHVRTRSSKR